MTASLPAARTVDINVDGSMLLTPTHDGPFPSGQGLSCLLGGLNEHSTGNVSSTEIDRRA
jgi:hypothetical protein